MKPIKSNNQIAIAACTFQVDIKATNIQLTPHGCFAAKDGRPFDVGQWCIDNARGKRLATELSARPNLVVDYEHATLHAKEKGTKAIAAGWMNKYEWRDNEGLFAYVEWTDAALSHIQSKEYRYISPVIVYDIKTGEVMDITMAALTNDPAVVGMKEVTALASKIYLTNQPEQKMDPILLAILKALGMTEGASEEEIVAEIEKLKSNAQEKTDEVVALSAKLKTSTPDPEKFVPIAVMTQLQTELAALSAKVNGNEIDTVVEAALDSGRLLPAQEEWARELGASNMASLHSFLDKAQPIAALSAQQTKGQEKRQKTEALSAEEKTICQKMGISETDFLATLNDSQ